VWPPWRLGWGKKRLHDRLILQLETVGVLGSLQYINPEPISNFSFFSQAQTTPLHPRTQLARLGTPVFLVRDARWEGRAPVCEIRLDKQSSGSADHVTRAKPLSHTHRLCLFSCPFAYQLTLSTHHAAPSSTDTSCEPLTTATLIKVGHNSTSMPCPVPFPTPPSHLLYVRARYSSLVTMIKSPPAGIIRLSHSQARIRSQLLGYGSLIGKRSLGVSAWYRSTFTGTMRTAWDGCGD